MGCKRGHLFSEQDIQHNAYTEHEVDIELLVVNEEQTIKINYNRHFVREDFEQYIQHNMQELLRTLEEETRGKQMYRPEDFPLVDMPEEELNQLLNKETRIVDIYELTALQKGCCTIACLIVKAASIKCSSFLILKVFWTSKN